MHNTSGDIVFVFYWLYWEKKKSLILVQILKNQQKADKQLQKWLISHHQIMLFPLLPAGLFYDLEME